MEFSFKVDDMKVVLKGLSNRAPSEILMKRMETIFKMLRFMHMTLNIEYVIGKKNMATNASLKMPAISTLSQVSKNWRAHFLLEYSRNTFACQLMDKQFQDDRYKVVEDVIYYKDKIFLVPKLKMKMIIGEIHILP